MDWKEQFNEGQELVLATASKSSLPNANIVVSLGFVAEKLLVANCQMNQTIKNLTENNRICVIGGYYRLKGTVEIFSSGEYFDLCQQKNAGYEVKSAILITVDEIFDLNDLKVIR
ncbi:TPA: flavin-nucleotide-binding protein [Candidatus Falkowbacteria bacterium]|nr:flavin-nucleotide-binding protein [Candidatus Falkowbacteria bacterium]